MSETRSTIAAFSSGEWTVAIVLALVTEGALVALLAFAGAAGSVPSREEEAKPEIPIEVLPVIDDLPLLKLGSKPRENQLPDMWRKPKPKKRYEDKSAPAENAEKQLDKLPENEVAKKDEDPAPEDAELAKKVDEDIPEEEKPEDAKLPNEGAEDGVKEGTETDPLKAFVVSQYRMKIIAWFKAGFTVPSDIEAAVLCQLLTRVRATVGSDRTVTGYTLQSSGNAVFDARVKAHMDRKQGQQLPPPPPNYNDILESIVTPTFSGETSGCKNKKPRTAPAAPDQPAPDQPESPTPEESPPPDPPVE
jgi:hypothetical protein